MLNTEQKELLNLLKIAWSESPKEALLELIGSCFGAGDISHIDDEILKENLQVLIELNREHKQRIERMRELKTAS